MAHRRIYCRWNLSLSTRRECALGAFDVWKTKRRKARNKAARENVELNLQHVREARHYDRATCNPCNEIHEYYYICRGCVSYFVMLITRRDDGTAGEPSCLVSSSALMAFKMPLDSRSAESCISQIKRSALLGVVCHFSAYHRRHSRNSLLLLLLLHYC